MIKALITDLAGTSIDFGSSAPAGAFIELFSRHHIKVSQQQARVPMGLEKRAHIVALASMPDNSPRVAYRLADTKQRCTRIGRPTGMARA